MHRAGAFTLVELILVMGLLCLIVGAAMPSLSRSFHDRNLTGEATRLLALTQYAQDEAVSLGVPMVLWLDQQSGEFGVRAKDGYEDAGAREKQFTLAEGLQFEEADSSNSSNGEDDVMEFEPDGTIDPSSVSTVRVVDRSKNAIGVKQTDAGDAYEILPENQDTR